VAYNRCHTPIDAFHFLYGSCIMFIPRMRLEKLRQVDLNLLIILAVIAEERSVTKASARLLLSQPAVSRALQRARSMFQDEL
jgi:Bacterial regulatory helix-turn-helix protein, lysR family